jgi:hypothetical protein|tara:strand:+ start:1292 stop:1501 length:210 start_codon:yes stop_codon:yes gene_type:complete
MKGEVTWILQKWQLSRYIPKDDELIALHKLHLGETLAGVDVRALEHVRKEAAYSRLTLKQKVNHDRTER